MLGSIVRRGANVLTPPSPTKAMLGAGGRLYMSGIASSVCEFMLGGRGYAPPEPPTSPLRVQNCLAPVESGFPMPLPKLSFVLSGGGFLNKGAARGLFALLELGGCCPTTEPLDCIVWQASILFLHS